MRGPASLLTAGLLVIAVAATSFFSNSSPIFAEDDHGDYRYAATALSVGGAALAGAIDAGDVLFDVDYFSFQARRGVRYTVVLDQLTVAKANVNVVNSLARGAGSSPGQKLTETGSQKSINWIARTTDTYFVEVAGTINNSNGAFLLGDYTISVFEDTTLLDRHSDNRNQATAIAVGNVYQGAISPWTNQPSLTGTVAGGDDVDYFSFQAQRGVRYTAEVDLETSEGVEVAIANPFDGIAKTNDGIGSTLTWISPSNNTYFVVVSGTGRVRNPSGSYRLRLTSDATLEDQHGETMDAATVVSFGNDHRGAVSPEDDRDYFSFPAERGVQYTIEATLETAAGVLLEILNNEGTSLTTSGGVGTTLEWSAPAEGTFFAVVSASSQVPDVIGTYSINLTSDTTLRDRHGDVPESATAVSLGNAHQGAVSPRSDLDYFAVQAERGVSYSVSLELGSASGAAISIENSAGESIAATGGQGTGLGWTAPDSGEFYVVVSHSPQATQGIGTYSLTVEANTSLEDRHSDSAALGTLLSFGTVYQGAISPETDLDFFAFPAERGVEYTLELTYGTTDAVTMSVKTLTGSAGSDARNFGEADILRWTADASGSYYVEISASPKAKVATGTYSLKITRDNALLDRHSDNAATATRIGFGNAISGAVSPADDVDYFFFSAIKDTSYTVTLNPGTAEAVRFTVENTPSEFTASNFGVDNTLKWTAPISGGYLLSVSASGRVGNPIGTYQITITPEGDALPPAPTTPTPGPTPGPTPRPTPVPASIDTALIVLSRTAPSGGTVRVPVRLNKSAEVTSLGFNLHYDPTILEVADVTRGSRLSASTFSHDAGVPGVIRFGFAVTNGATHEGSAAVVEFKVIGEMGSVSPLTLSDALVSHSSEDPLDVQLIGGDLTVRPRIRGDGDGDGSVTALDALIALKGGQQDAALDINGDGKVDQADARLILAMARPGN